MVSLDHDSTRQGGVFFDGEGGPSSAEFQNDDEELIPSNGLASEESPKFRPIRAIWAAIIQMIILVAHEVISLLMPYTILKQTQDPQQKKQSQSFIIIIYLQTSVWLLLLMFERYLHFAHRRSMRHGYLQFYRKTQKLKRAPLYLVSIGNAAILVLSGLFMDNSTATNLWPVMYVQIIVTLEVILALASLLRYTVLVYHFNQRRALPDVEQEEFNASITQPSTTIPDIGYRDMGYLENLLERQADMIHYLKLHTAYLSKKILRLTKLTHPSGGNSLNSMQA
ncbi:transmembrane protein 192 [Strongylocentrotus purpuratus]|uniref:Transmembrane protein 192 n=1 Tax=Strongylocentrotus purpuratus TaxID=7668 RepID=A0A7M7NBR0_STRPU|nr:transmembrane protein 192 [Strongylocentrotus purpuratus]